MTDFTWQFGERFRIIRKKEKMNQDAFGDLLGVSRQTINAYENNRQRPPLDMMEKVCAKFMINPVWLLSGFGEQAAEKYPETEGREQLAASIGDLLSTEQKALIDFIAHNGRLASKLTHFLLEQGLSSLGPGSKLSL